MHARALRPGAVRRLRGAPADADRDEVVQLRVLLPDGRAGIAVGNRVDDEGLAALGRAGARGGRERAPPDPESPGLAEPAPSRRRSRAATRRPLARRRRRRRGRRPRRSRPRRARPSTASSRAASASSRSPRRPASRPSSGRPTRRSPCSPRPRTSPAGRRGRSWRAGDLDLEGCARRGGREGRADAGRRRASSRAATGRCSSRTRSASCSRPSATTCFNGLALARGAKLPRRPARRARLRPEGLDRRRRARPAQPAEGVRLRGRAEAARSQLAEDGVARGVVLGPRDRPRAAGARRPATRCRRRARLGPARLRARARPAARPASVEELAELVGDGIYVTRVHYLGTVDPREGILTGMTRDGTFRIRGGRIAEPLVNHRFTLSMPELLADVPGLTRERRSSTRTTSTTSATRTGRSSPRSRPAASRSRAPARVPASDLRDKLSQARGLRKAFVHTASPTVRDELSRSSDADPA